MEGRMLPPRTTEIELQKCLELLQQKMAGGLE